MGVRRFIFVSVCYAFVPRSFAQPAGSCLLQAHTTRSQGQTPQEHDLDSLVESNQDGLALAVIQGNVHHIESVIASQVEDAVQERDVPADVASNFQAIRDYLTTLRNALLVEHSNDQNATDRLRGLASSCFDTMTKTEVDARRTKHSECRVEQGKSSGRKGIKCKTFEDKKAALPAAPCTLSTVVGADPVADAETYIACLHQLNLWSAKVQDLWSAHLACKNATDNETDTKQECGTKQTSFEAGFCSLVGACDCHSEHAQAFTVQRTQMEKSEAGRRASFNAAARIECFISVLEGNSTLRNESYHDCRSLDVNTTHLFIEYDPIPSAGDSCTFSSGKPCDTTWVNAEYTTASWYSKAPTEDCADCPTTTLTTSPSSDDAVDVKMVGGAFPQVKYQGEWYPICAEHWNDNNNGATLVCKALGHKTGWVVHNAATSISVNAMPVGRCLPDDKSLDSCTGGFNHWGDLKQLNCRPGHTVSWAVRCSD